jgi:hypothetical protein
MMAAGEEEGEMVCMSEAAAVEAAEAELGMGARAVGWLEAAFLGTVEEGMGDLEEEGELNEKAMRRDELKQEGGEAETVGGVQSVYGGGG